MSAGDLRDKIVISRIVRIPDGMGGYAEDTREAVVEAWADVRIPAAKAGVVGGAEAEIRTHVVRVRQCTGTMGVQINDIVTWRGTDLTIRACRPMDRAWLDFDCIREEPS